MRILPRGLGVFLVRQKMAHAAPSDEALQGMPRVCEGPGAQPPCFQNKRRLIDMGAVRIQKQMTVRTQRLRLHGLNSRIY
jgi:hypothetical protein